jgi:hypothetical protein
MSLLVFVILELKNIYAKENVNLIILEDVKFLVACLHIMKKIKEKNAFAQLEKMVTNVERFAVYLKKLKMDVKDYAI